MERLKKLTTVHRGTVGEAFFGAGLAAVMAVAWVLLCYYASPMSHKVYWGTTIALGMIAVGNLVRGAWLLRRKSHRGGGPSATANHGDI